MPIRNRLEGAVNEGNCSYLEAVGLGYQTAPQYVRGLQQLNEQLGLELQHRFSSVSMVSMNGY